MNTDTGTFDPIPPATPDVFKTIEVGEYVQLKGEWCQVAKFPSKSEVTIRLLSREECVERGLRPAANRHERRAQAKLAKGARTGDAEL